MGALLPNKSRNHMVRDGPGWPAVIKLKFGYTKVRYRGIRKNANQVFTLCALSNQFLSRGRLLVTQGA
jgi:IS5 family transposase